MSTDTAQLVLSHGLSYGFGRAQFEQVRALIYGRAGIALSDAKQQMAFNRLVRRLRALQIVEFSSYLTLLDDQRHAEWPFFVNALTTNVTSFFREAHHFERLKTHLQATGKLSNALLWSAGCATGEEPYTLALCLAEVAGLDARFRILATDIDSEALAKAKAAHYGEASVGAVGTMSAPLKKLGFDTAQGAWMVRPALAAHVSFSELNLVAAQWPHAFANGGFDAIFCRNVMIYFDQATQRKLLTRFAAALAPGGLLFAGHAEMLFHSPDLFESLGQTIYRVRRAA